MEPKKAAPKVTEGQIPYLPSEDGFDGGIVAADPSMRYVGANAQSAASLRGASKAITQVSQLEPDAYYSYEDYCTWQFEERVELIYGKVYVMSPSPTDGHQSISAELFFQFYNHNRGKDCIVRSAPYDVVLQADSTLGRVSTVVQPDICVICDPAKRTPKGCVGAPDLVVEILSPSSKKYDLGVKFSLYEANAIKELWYVSPEKKTITVHILQADGLYGPPIVYAANAKVPVATLPGLNIDLGLVWATID